MGSDQLEQQMRLTLEILQQTSQQNQQIIQHLLEENKTMKEELRELRTLVIPNNQACVDNQAQDPYIQQRQVKQEPMSQIQKEVLRRVKRNQKEFVIRKIQEIAAIRNCPIAELKAIIVDDFGYCSKATFYRYMQQGIEKGFFNQIEDKIICDNRH